MDKKRIIMILIATILLIAFFITRNTSMYSSTTASIRIEDKQEYRGKKWIIAVNQSEDRIQITIEDPQIWNTITKGEIYLITYDSKNGKHTLKTINPI